MLNQEPDTSSTSSSSSLPSSSSSSASSSPSSTSSSSYLHLFPRTSSFELQKQVDDLLANTTILATYKQFEQEPLSTTFRPYIKHLPGDFHISKKGNVSKQGSLKKVVLDPSILSSSSPSSSPPQQPISFHSLNFLQLESAFTLQDGGYVKKKKKRRSADGENGEKKKRKKDHTSSGEPKKKRKKKDAAASALPLPTS